MKHEWYDTPESCNRCGIGKNTIVVKDSIEGTPSEHETKCQLCGFVDYWAFGYFESNRSLENPKCAQYRFDHEDNGKMIFKTPK